MPFADTADGRVARHLPERFDVVGKQERVRAHAGGGQRGFCAGVSAADDDDVVGVGVGDGGHVVYLSDFRISGCLIRYPIGSLKMGWRAAKRVFASPRRFAFQAA